jgi:nickel-dependent lactate racemase
LSYGNDEQTLELPHDQTARFLKPTGSRSRESKDGDVFTTVQSPDNFRKLGSLLENVGQLCIIVPDKTRNCGAPIVLPALIKMLSEQGISDSSIKIVLALGSHPPHQAQEIVQIVGADLVKRFEIIEHDCRDDSLVFLGTTKFGTPVRINRHLTEADRIIAVAGAVHHYFAGYGGGPKMINPGCAGYETITKNHALSVDRDSGGIHPNCRAGVVDGNPIQEDILDSLRFISVDFLIESVLNQEGEIKEVFLGELLETHQTACQTVDAMYKVPIQDKADIVVVSCGGYPKDINLIQSHKSLNNAFQAVKEGGVIVCLAECRDGIGSQTFLDWFDYAEEDQLLDRLTRNYTLNGTTALSLRMKAKKCHIVFVSTLPDEMITKLGMTPASDVTDGWQKALAMLPAGFDCYAMPNGSLTLPYQDV